MDKTINELLVKVTPPRERHSSGAREASAKAGGFNRVRGGGVKGPVKTLMRLAARRLPVVVVSVSEHRMSI